MKIVTNKSFGGFSVSNAVFDELGMDILNNSSFGMESENEDAYRSHPDFVKAIEKLGDNANGPHAKLVITEIPDEVEWQLHDYDNFETVDEKHRTWE